MTPQFPRTALSGHSRGSVRRGIRSARQGSVAGARANVPAGSERSPSAAASPARFSRPRTRSLNWRLTWAALSVALPPVLVTLILVGWIARDDHVAKRNMLISEVHSLADAVTGQIDSYAVLARSLSRSSLLINGDLNGFAEQAKYVLEDTSGVGLRVYSPEAELLVSVPASLNKASVPDSSVLLVRKAISTRSTFMSDVTRPPGGGTSQVAIESPVVRDGSVIYELEFLVDADAFAAVLQRRNYPNQWLSGVIDRAGAFVARIPANADMVGALSSPEFRSAAREATPIVATHKSIDGREIVSAYDVLDNGWTVGVAVDADQFEVGPSAVLLTAALALLALTASLALSFQNGRRLSRQIRDLQTKAQQLVTGEPIAAATSGVDELDALSRALAQASRILRRRSDRQKSAEETLRSSEEHFRLLADSVPQLVWTARPDGRIDYANARRDAYGPEGVSRTDWETIIHPDDRRATAEAWLKASEAGTPYEKEHRLLVGGRTYRWHLSRAAPLLDEAGAIIRWYGTTTDINEHKLREERIRSLIGEVNHRSRNLLTVAQSIARQSVKSGETAADFEQKYSQRLMALTASQDLLTERQWVGVAVEALVRAQTRGVGATRARPVEIDGPPLLLRPSAAQTLGIAIHELYTNALTFGALSTPTGVVSVSWRARTDGSEPQFEIEWRERGGPTVSAHPKQGFGALLISTMTAKGLSAVATLDFDSEGVVWTLRAPLSVVSSSA